MFRNEHLFLILFLGKGSIFLAAIVHIIYEETEQKQLIMIPQQSGRMEEYMSILNNDEIPVGLSMALAENLRAMERFSNMNEQEKQEFISRSRAVGSKQEMRNLVSGLK